MGLELAQAYRRFGSAVTVIEHAAQIAGREDPDVASELARLLEAEGITLRTGMEVVRVSGRSGETVAVTLREARAKQL